MIEITSDAQRKLQEVIDRTGQSDTLVRVAAVRGPHGCIHGWRLALEEHAGPKDTVVRAGEVKVLVDVELTETLRGAVVDYREDANSIGFTINAPSASVGHEHGGCGHG